MAAAKTFCLKCGAEVAPWFESRDRIYDMKKDDAAYERWLDTPCPTCRSTPRANLAAAAHAAAKLSGEET